MALADARAAGGHVDRTDRSAHYPLLRLRERTRSVDALGGRGRLPHAPLHLGAGAVPEDLLRTEAVNPATERLRQPGDSFRRAVFMPLPKPPDGMIRPQSQRFL